METAESPRRKLRAAMASIGVNVFLLALKLTVALLTGSIALWASAADSLLDLTASGFAYTGVKLGTRPPDETHAYGHQKFESLSSLVQLAMLFITVGIIAGEAWSRLFGDPGVDTPLTGVGVIVVAMAVDLWVTRLLSRTARETGGSQALEADALHFATDVWSNVAVIVGLVAVRAGFDLGDPLAAFVVAALVAVTAVNLVRDTLGVLADRAPDEATVRRIGDTIDAVPQTRGFHTLRARMVGQRIFLDVCVELDPSLTFAQAHDVSHHLQERLRDVVPQIADAVIHVEPAGHPEHQDEHHRHGYDALFYDRPVDAPE